MRSFSFRSTALFIVATLTVFALLPTVPATAGDFQTDSVGALSEVWVWFATWMSNAAPSPMSLRGAQSGKLAATAVSIPTFCHGAGVDPDGKCVQAATTPVSVLTLCHGMGLDPDGACAR